MPNNAFTYIFTIYDLKTTLVDQTVPFQKRSLSLRHVGTQFATTPGQSGSGSDSNERGTTYSPKIQHYESLTIWLANVIFRTLVVVGVIHLNRDAVGVFYSPNQMHTRWGCLTLLQRCSRCILQPQPNGPTLGVFYPSAEMQLLYSTTPANRSLVGGPTPLQRCSRHIPQSQHTDPSLRALPLCNDEVGVFYDPRKLGCHLFEFLA